MNNEVLWNKFCVVICLFATLLNTCAAIRDYYLGDKAWIWYALLATLVLYWLIDKMIRNRL